MATIYNSNLSKELIEGGKLQTARDNIPNQIAEKVVPVMEVNPKLVQEINVVKSVTGAGVIYTTPANRDFYLSSVILAAYTNLAAQASAATVTVVLPDGYTETVALVRFATTAIVDVASQNVSLTLPYPLKLKRNSAITLVNANTSSLYCTITGSERSTGD